VQQRLAIWCVGFAREAVPGLVRADRTTWLPRLHAELPNLLAALSWTLEREREELARELAEALGEYWYDTNGWQEGLTWLETIIEHATEASPRLRATALLYRARLIGIRHHEQYRDDMQAALDLFRVTDDAAGSAACLAHLAVAETWIGRDQQARALSRDALRFAERTNDERVVAFALKEAALTATGYEDAIARARPAMPALERTGDLRNLSFLCSVTGYLAIAESRDAEALRWLDRGLTAAHRLDDPLLIYVIRANQGLARLFRGELDEAALAFRDALAICHDAAMENEVDEPLLGMAAVAARQGDLALAARLAGAAGGHEIASRIGFEETIWARLNGEFVARAREHHGAENWDRAAEEGAALSVPDAIDLALGRGRFASTAAAATAPSATYQSPIR